MKRRLVFLVGLPLLWLAVALVSYQDCADRAYILAIAPSAWVLFFGGWLSHSILIGWFAGLPPMVLVGFILLKLRMTPRGAMISSLLLTVFLWVALLILSSKGTAIRVPGAPFVWFLCCFNLSLCFLPFLALLGIIGSWLTGALRRTRAAK